MPAIVFDNFAGGLDRRRSRAIAATNVLWILKNAYITTGKTIRKRPCLRKLTTLEGGTKGLVAALGKLNTFYANGTITHSHPLFVARRAGRNASSGDAVTDATFGFAFNGYLYASMQYASGTRKHHYFDDPGAWTNGTVIALNAYRRPTVANGFRYRASVGGTTAGAEPAWPTTLGGTVVDNTVTWTCESFEVTDVNCPHGKFGSRIQQKVYTNSGSNVAYCKTTDPRDWTASGDAGFLPTGINAAGSDTVTGIGDFKGDLSVFFADSMQVWDIDPDPDLNALKDTADNVGTLHGRSVRPLASDQIFLEKKGFRSVSLVVLTDNLQEDDVGSPIDALRSEIADTDEPISVYYPKLGQFVCLNGTKAYVYTFSKKAKISAWSTFEWPVPVQAAAVLNNELYIRSGDDVYVLDDTVYSDNGTIPLVEVEMFYQDNKAPGILKQFTGFDGVTTGTWEVAWRFDPRNTNLITPFVEISGDMRPGDLFPMEINATSLAPVFRHQLDEEAQIDALQCYYEKLAPLS